MNISLFRKLSLWNRARLDKRRARKIPYARWITAHDSLTPAVHRALVQHADKIGTAALISIVLEVRASDRFEWLQATVESIRQQIYPHWELLIHIAGGVPDTPSRWVQDLAQTDARLKPVQGAPGGARTEGLQLAITQAKGAFLVFLSPTGLLRPHALLTLATAIQQQAPGRIFYADEDDIDARGERSNPRLKPTWNAYLLRARNYLGPLCALDARLVQQLGGFDPAFQHDPVYDLILRGSESLPAQGIVHIPFILYHALGRPPADASVSEDGRLAVQAHLRRVGLDGTVALEAGINVVRHAMPHPLPRVSILIPSRDRPELLKKCVTTVLKATAYADFEVLFIDNGTANEEALRIIRELAQDPRFKVLVDASPFNYSRLNNQGAASATGELLCLLNNDVEITDPDWLSKLVAVCTQDEVGVVGPRLLFPSGQLQHAGVILGIGGVAGHPFSYKPGDAPTHMDRARIMHELSAVTGACLLTPKALYQQHGGLDETLSVTFNDIDYCLKVRSHGKKVIYVPQVELIHHESASRGKDNTTDKKTRFAAEIQYMRAKWPTWLDHDPAYNPNLTLKSDSFSLADPPRVRLLSYLAQTA